MKPAGFAGISWDFVGFGRDFEDLKSLQNGFNYHFIDETFLDFSENLPAGLKPNQMRKKIIRHRN